MALSAARNTKSQSDLQFAPNVWGVKATTQIWKGSLVALNAGYAAPGATATSRVAVGRAKTSQLGGASDGLVVIETEQGTFKWANSGTDAVVAADVGSVVYIEDDQTVSHTATGKSIAGLCVQLDTDGVWVRTVLKTA